MICMGCFGERDDGSGPCPCCGYGGEGARFPGALSPGTVLGGRYMLGNVIHSNEHAITYRGYDRLLDTFVSVRQKRGRLSEEEFMKKARWLAYCGPNKNVIDCYSCERLPDGCFLVMQDLDIVSGRDASDGAGGEFQAEFVSVREGDVIRRGGDGFVILDFDIAMPYPNRRFSGPQPRFDTEGEGSCFLREGAVLQRGRYEVICPLGKGGFGVTYLARDTFFDRHVAVKEYMPSDWVLRDPEDGCVDVVSATVLDEYREGLRNFHQEAVCLASLRGSDAVVRMYDYFTENETAYIVMEYVDGENVGRFGKLIGGFSYEAAKDIFKKLLEALEAIHAKGIVHEDISPGNIILTKENRVKLIDFGSAHRVGEGIKTLADMMIKPGYAAPEQYDEEYAADVRTDLYQAAATFYTLVTGRKPVGASERWRGDAMPFPSELGFEIPGTDEAVLRRSMELLPANRYAGAAEMLRELA